jgi:chemotaxis protein MotB
VIAVILKEAADFHIGIEGHTDNQPIKYSSWKSNWELSTARATSVLHYLESQGVKPYRMAAIGYGEYRPVDSNETEPGRRKNRRVEIIILPELKKSSDKELGQVRATQTGLLEPVDNLK